MEKRVLFLQSAIGGAHQSVANAIVNALEELSPCEFRCQVVDVFKSCSVFPLGLIVHLYPCFLIHHPSLWKWIYYSTRGQLRFKMIERMAGPLIKPNLIKLIAEMKPDAIVLVVHSVANLVARAMKDLNLDIPLIVVVVDLVTIHPAWVSPEVHWYVVHSAAAKRAFVKYGVDERKIKVYGLPIDQNFNKKDVDKREIKFKLGIQPDLFTALVIGGGEGSGKILTTVKTLSATALPIQLLVVTGRNSKLQYKLQRIRYKIPVKIFGFVNNMAELMRASDVVITKAGPSSIVEAINTGLPVIITSAIPGQEEGNDDYVLENGVGMVVRNHRDLVNQIDRLISESYTYEHMVRKTKELCVYNSANLTAELITNAISVCKGKNVI